MLRDLVAERDAELESLRASLAVLQVEQIDAS